MEPPVDEEYVRDVETKLGVTLPTPLRDRLLQSNGGEISTSEPSYDLDTVWELFPIRDSSSEARLRETAMDIVDATLEYREFESFPADAVAFAGADGDVLILRPGSGRFESWEHETGETAPEQPDGSLKVTADELTTLVNALNEILHGPDVIEDWEFVARVGVERDQARVLLDRLTRELDRRLRS